MKWWLQRLEGEENGEFLFSGSRVSVRDEEKVLQVDSGDGWITMRTRLMPGGYTLKNGYDGKCYVITTFKE